VFFIVPAWTEILLLEQTSQSHFRYHDARRKGNVRRTNPGVPRTGRMVVNRCHNCIIPNGDSPRAENFAAFYYLSVGSDYGHIKDLGTFGRTEPCRPAQEQFGKLNVDLIGWESSRNLRSHPICDEPPWPHKRPLVRIQIATWRSICRLVL
jgi:hypothetical protein